MSFGKIHETLSIFASFLKNFFEVIDPGLISEIIYIPGNHDHHMWEMARETHYSLILAAGEGLKGFPEMKHTTGPNIHDGIRSAILDSTFDCIYENEKPTYLPTIKVVYPNLILNCPKKQKTSIIHHGHFVEDLYNFVSLTRKVLHPKTNMPNEIEDVEAENFAWIDFIWSTLGRSGKAGYDVELIMKILGHPKESKKEIDILADRISKALDFPFIPFDAMEKFLIKTITNRMAKRIKFERANEKEVCTQKTLENVLKYISGPCANQYEAYFDKIPNQMSFIWGHTHKPFEKKHLLEGGGELHIYNTGGWTVDGLDPDAVRGGTFIVMNTDLDIVNINVFDNRDTDGEIQLTANTIDTTTNFYKSINETIVQMPNEILENLKISFAREILLRRKYYAQKSFFDKKKSESGDI